MPLALVVISSVSGGRSKVGWSDLRDQPSSFGQLKDRGTRWSGFVLHGAFGGDVKSFLVGRCYARQICQNLHVWMDERGTVAPLGAMVTSSDGRTDKDDAYLSPEDGSAVR
ncbi:Serine/threonine-protein kinase HT1 [Hordeum vulgare]|nr:Serine/threonine-protein kinase HT1 [Hordeum vulgare]